MKKKNYIKILNKYNSNIGENPKGVPKGDNFF